MIARACALPPAGFWNLLEATDPPAAIQAVIATAHPPAQAGTLSLQHRTRFRMVGVTPTGAQTIRAKRDPVSPLPGDRYSRLKCTESALHRGWPVSNWQPENTGAADRCETAIALAVVTKEIVTAVKCMRLGAVSLTAWHRGRGWRGIVPVTKLESAVRGRKWYVIYLYGLRPIVARSAACSCQQGPPRSATSSPPIDDRPGTCHRQAAGAGRAYPAVAIPIQHSRDSESVPEVMQPPSALPRRGKGVAARRAGWVRSLWLPARPYAVGRGSVRLSRSCALRQIRPTGIGGRSRIGTETKSERVVSGILAIPGCTICPSATAVSTSLSSVQG